ncbi:hypothetical protein GCM10011515_12530 [Tsuneonella deserti]|uniref:Uncharacterized protein n=1 Tax=Tsuneonella deserti TaxID=2035528 RepID=A0ABQ1S905_9SPHN|nr:hypothetical protein [Tsuneonella deserti]GGD94225.1 hypothetical protein GCM10011515_12530 [Tsuneonella deserti]
MKQAFRAFLGMVLGLATVLFGQLTIENSAWWMTGGTATFDDPLFNAIKFAVAVAAGIAVAGGIALAPKRRRRML